MYEFCKRLSHIHETLPFIRVNIEALAHDIKNFNVKLFANADASANAGGSTIALPELCPDELKRKS